MTKLVETSLVVRWLRRVKDDSMLAESFSGLCRRVHGAASPGSSLIVDLLVLHSSGKDFQHASRIALNSPLLAYMERPLVLVAIAWREATHAGGTSFLPFHRAWPTARWQRVRLVGWMLLVAALTHATFTGSDRSLSPSGLAGLAGVLVLAIGLMLGCRAIASAWEHQDIFRQEAGKEVGDWPRDTQPSHVTRSRDR